MSIEVLCTLGPSSMNERVIRRLEEAGATLFRINLSHTRLKDVVPAIALIQGFTRVPVCLDSEGAQIRTGKILAGSVELAENSIVRLPRKRVAGSPSAFNFWPLDIVDQLEEGDFVSIDFNAVLAQVVARDADGVSLRILNGGKVGSSKAVTVDRHIDLPPLTADDGHAFRAGLEMGVRHFALSFANRAGDVEFARAIIGRELQLISKIESLDGLANLDGIAKGSDALLIDRGDLSRQVPLEHIPVIQKKILKRGRELGIKVYVATNLLESMVTLPFPTRAEVNDIYNTLADGANGLVMAAETAVGAYPIRCVTMVQKLIQKFTSAVTDQDPLPFDIETISLLAPPHGGKLVERTAKPQAAQGVRTIRVSKAVIHACENIAHGLYSPVAGFMEVRALAQVLRDWRLPCGALWPMPILCQVPEAVASGLKPGERIALAGDDGKPVAVLDLNEVGHLSAADLPSEAKALALGGGWILAGDVTWIASGGGVSRPYRLSPAQARFVFTHKGWQRVVLHAAKLPAHRMAQALHAKALEEAHADGLFICPAFGLERAGDFTPAQVLESYRLLVEFGEYPPGSVVLGSSLDYPRALSADRDAVFKALCGKNMGCTHILLDGGESGVGPAFEKMGDIGVEPIFASYALPSDAPRGAKPPTWDEAKRALAQNGKLPEWFMQDFVQDLLRHQSGEGAPS